MIGGAAIVVSLLGGILGHAVGGVSSSLSPGRGALIGVVAAVVSAVIGFTGDEASERFARVEMLMVALAAVAVVVSSGATDRTFPVVIGVGLALLVRSLVRGTVRDISMLTRVTDDPVGSGPIDRLRTRVLAIGIGLAVIVGYSVGSGAGLADLGRGAVRGTLVTIVIWFVLGIGGVGTLARRAREWHWTHDQVEVDPDVSNRWIAGVIGTMILIATVMVVVPYVTSDASAFPGRAAAGAGGFGNWIADGLDRLGNLGGGDRPDIGGEEGGGARPAEALIEELPDRPDWVGDAALMLLLGGFLAWIIHIARRRRLAAGALSSSPAPWGVLRDLIHLMIIDIRKLIVSLLTWLRGLRFGRGDRSESSGVGLGASTGRAANRWTSADPLRQRIGRAFARAVALEPPVAGETPGEVGARLGRRSEPEAAEQIVDGYLVARYSEHLVDADTVKRVEDAVETLTAGLSTPDRADSEGAE